MYRYLLLLLLVIAVPLAGVIAQENTTALTPINAQTPLPASYYLTGIRHEYQGWNNCGPATVTNALTYFGYTDNQYTAAAFLKPNSEDKNVSPWELVTFVNTQVPGTTQALTRYGTGLDDIKTLIANNFPVIIEAGYDPETDPQGWMGHYLLVTGYDDSTQTFMTQDSFLGPNYTYSYEHVTEFWRHFNRRYVVLYDFSQEAQVMALLGTNADVNQNVMNALEVARAEASANQQDSFAWFNMGTAFVDLGLYEQAAVAYDQARTVGEGLPWRMLWYQFGPYEAYNQVGRYSETLTLATAILNDGGGQWVEETFFYAGQAREAMGDTQRALENYRQAAYLNSNFTAAVEARNRLQA